MKKLLVLLVVSFTSFKAQIYTAKDGATNISFFSKAPLEDIEATNKGATIVFKSTTGDIQVRISIQNFRFKNKLMEEHFNENYMESDKFPNAEFKGKINENIDYSKEGEQKVTVSGKLDMHGVTKPVTLSGTITKEGNDYKMQCKTAIHVADYNIKVPSMYVKNIAENVDVNFETTLAPFQKK